MQGTIAEMYHARYTVEADTPFCCVHRNTTNPARQTDAQVSGWSFYATIIRSDTTNELTVYEAFNEHMCFCLGENIQISFNSIQLIL